MDAANGGAGKLEDTAAEPGTARNGARPEATGTEAGTGVEITTRPPERPALRG
jgi:hypothetical protein